MNKCLSVAEMQPNVQDDLVAQWSEHQGLYSFLVSATL